MAPQDHDIPAVPLMLAPWPPAPPEVLPPVDIVNRLLLAILQAPDNALAGLQVEACVRRRLHEPEQPVVWARLGAFSAVMTPATARDVAVRLVDDGRYRVTLGRPAALGLKFTQAADGAEQLAGGATAPTEESAA